MMPDFHGVTWPMVAMFVTFVLYQYFLHWRSQSSQRAAAEQLKAEVAHRAKEVQTDLDEKRTELKTDIVKKIEENTEISKNAFNDANHFNEKFLDLSVRVERLEKRELVPAEELRERLSHIEEKINTMTINPR